MKKGLPLTLLIAWTHLVVSLLPHLLLGMGPTCGCRGDEMQWGTPRTNTQHVLGCTNSWVPKSPASMTLAPTVPLPAPFPGLSPPPALLVSAPL